MANDKFISSETLFAWGSSFNTTKKIPVIAKRVWQTYEDMFNYVSDANDTCIAGIVLTVVNDEDVTKNGAYFVVSCPTLEEPTITPAVKKIGSDEGISEDINDIKTLLGDDSSGLVKDVEDIKSTKADASTVYTKDEADGKYVAKEGYVAYTQDEKDKLAGLANIKSVGDNLNVDASGKLTVTIPEVEVPFQSVATDDKLLTLSDGVLKSDVSFGIVGSKIQLTGKDNVVIGEVDTTDFVVDGVLDSVDWSEEQGKENFLVLTWNTDAGKKPMEIDFGKYVDAYSAGEGITLTDKAFAVDYSKVEKAGSAATAEQNAKDYADSLATNYDASGAAASVEAKLDAYIESNDIALAAKVNGSEYSNKMTEIDGSISSIKSDISNVYTKTEVNDLVSPLAVKADVSTALDLKANVNEVYTKTEVNDLVSPLAVKADVSTALDLKANVNEVYTKTEVNDLVSPLATSEALTNGLATKLDSSVKVNGVEFTNGAATIVAGDITLGTAITSTSEKGGTYSAENTIQEVLASLSSRIDVLDPNISGEFGVSSVTAGNGIEVTGTSSTPTISVKTSVSAGNIAEVKTDGVYVADMRSYWEGI